MADDIDIDIDIDIDRYRVNIVMRDTGCGRDVARLALVLNGQDALQAANWVRGRAREIDALATELSRPFDPNRTSAVIAAADAELASWPPAELPDCQRADTQAGGCWEADGRRRCTSWCWCACHLGPHLGTTIACTGT